MINIAIVEDEDEAAEILSAYIRRYYENTDEKFCVKRYRDAVQFLTDYTAEYAVVFMDIQMPNCNGFNASMELRKIDKTVSIVFITNLIQYAQKGYEVDAVAYMVKPVEYYDFALKFRKALDCYLKYADREIIINTSNGPCMISTDELMYVEILRHRLYYRLIDGVIEKAGVLSKVESELKKFGFLRCNQCYLVNPRFIVSVKGLRVQVGPKKLNISRPRKKEFLAGFAEWCAEFIK